jgi:hypothetical protein
MGEEIAFYIKKPPRRILEARFSAPFSIYFNKYSNINMSVNPGIMGSVSAPVDPSSA